MFEHRCYSTVKALAIFVKRVTSTMQVRQLSNKSVSWIRRRDAHILTVDRFTFIADERFQAFLVEATDTWTLQVHLAKF